MKAIAINTARMANELHAQFSKSVLTLIEKMTAVALGIVSTYALYKQAIENELEALLLIRKSKLTAKISEQDSVRDTVFRGFSTAIKSARSHFDPEMRNEANLLWDILLHYGNIAKKTLHKQTAAMDDMLKELEKPDFQHAIDVLHLRDWVDKMSEENQKFHQLVMERYNERMGKTTFRMKTARVETDKYYKALTSHFDNLVTIEENTPLTDEFVTELNILIKEYKDILAQEFGRRNASAKEKVKCEVCEK